MNFKAQVERDLTAVFHNAREHADVMEFWIDGVRYKGPVIIDDGGAQDRKKPSTDHVDGLVLVDLVVYVPLESGSPHYNRIEESRRGGNARRFSWGAACSVQLLQRPQRQFLWRDELEQRLQRQQRRSPALVETAIE